MTEFINVGPAVINIVGPSITTVTEQYQNTPPNIIPPFTGVSSSAGTFNTVVVGNNGLVLSGFNATYGGGNITLSATGAVVGTATGSNGSYSLPLVLAASGITPGTYNTAVFNAAGLAISGSNAAYLTSISSSQVTTALGFTPTTPIISTAGTFNVLVINSAGQVTGGSNSAFLTANQTITFSGDATGSGSTSVALTLANVATAGTYQSVVINSKGLVTSGSALTSGQVTTALGFTPTTPIISTAGTYNVLVINSAGQVTGGSNSAFLTANQTITFSGDATGSGSTSVALTLANVATAGTYQSVVINSKGLVTSGSPLTSGQVTTALGFTPTTPIVSMAGTYNSIVINSAGQVISGSNATYGGGNLTVTATGAVTGTASSSTGTLTLPTTLAASGITPGTYNTAVFNAAGIATAGSNAAYLTSINSSQVTTALGYTPTTPIVSTSGTYNVLVINSAGQVTGGSNSAFLTANQTITFSGDATGSGTTAVALTLASVGTVGTYSKVVTDAKGRVIAGGAIVSSDVTTALGYTPVNPNVLGASNGIATLNSSGQLNSSQIPSSLVGAVVYQGTWNASTNTPTLTSSVGTQGFYYIVSTAGTTSLNGIAVWNVNDTAIYNGTAWDKIDGQTSEVISVAGRTGVVTLSISDISGAAPLASPTFTGTPTTPTPLLTDNSGNIANTSWVKEQNYLTANQTITFSGDATGSGSTSVALTLASVATAGTYQSVVINSKGLVTSGSPLTSGQVTTALGYTPTTPIVSTSGTYNVLVINSAGQVTGGSNSAFLTSNQTITFSGDATGSGSTSVALTLASVATAGTYQSVVINSKGLVTSGSALTSGQVTTALGYTPSTPVVTTAGTFNNFVLNNAGQVISGSFVTYASAYITAVGSNLSVTSGTLNVSIGVSSFNTRTGAVTLTSGDVTTALGFTPTTPIVSTAGTYQSVVLNSAGQVTSGSSLTSGQVTTALGFTPTTPVISTAGTYNVLVINSAGQVTGGSNSAFLTANQAITFSGDATGSGSTSVALTLANVATAGTYQSVVINSKGLVTSGSALTSGQITTALGYTPTTPIVSTSGTYNVLVINSAGQVTGGSNSAFLTANQTITFSGDATGSGSTSVALTLASVATAGTYQSVVVNSKGLVTSGSAIPSAAYYQGSSLSPTGASSVSVYQMQGFNATITPARTGNIFVTFSGTLLNYAQSAAGSGVNIIMKYGTGTPPSNGASSTGTTIGGISGCLVSATQTINEYAVPFSLSAIAASLTIGTTYWFDLAIENISQNNRYSLNSTTATIIELA